MPLKLRNTLCEARDALHMVRTAIATRDQFRSIQDMGALIGLAEVQSIQAINAIDTALKFLEESPCGGSESVPDSPGADHGWIEG
jgi:hypothetical protein